MKKLLVFIGTLFICVVAFAQTINVNWKIDDTTYATNTCEYGGTMTVPTAPTKYGYTFQGWKVGYIELAYIESTGTQWIDTGYVPTNTTRLDIKYKVTQLPSNLSEGAMPIGARVGWQDRMFEVISPVNQLTTNTILVADGAPIYITNSFNPLDKGIIATIDIPNKYSAFDVEGRVYSSSASIPNVTYVYPLYMFQKNNAGIVTTSDAHIRIYYVQIKENNVLVRNFIPAKRLSDNAIGMYDTVTGRFFANAGTGEFIAGPEVGVL